MAEKPEEIKARFITQSCNAAGIFLMSFFVNGIETPLIVDDYLPTRNARCCFTRSKEEELWVSLLEKGWAKLHGTYARTEGGQSAQAAYHV
jgi:hypothetical protein